VGGHPIALSAKLCYLGVILDKRLTFAPHVSAVAKIASRSAVSLARLIPNVKSPCQWKRRLLASVTESQLLYVAPYGAEGSQLLPGPTQSLYAPKGSPH